MIKELIHPIAVDIEGKIININQAQKGDQYFCPYCKGKFIFNRSIKQGKGSRRTHFSHEVLTPNCTSEGYLHSTFKIMLLEILQNHIAAARPFEINFKCNICQNIHTIDLLGIASAAKSEYDLKVARPDIALLREDGNVYAVIEIVDTHDLENSVINFYRDSEIFVVKIILESEDDLEKVEERSKSPSEVTLCNQEQCPVFRNSQPQFPLGYRRLIVQPGVFGNTGPKIDQINKTMNNRQYSKKGSYKRKGW
jgi:hypothetical protein